MPVAPASATPARHAVLVGLGALLGLVAIVFVVLQASRLTDNSADVSFGIDTTATFQPGPADEMAATIANEGPLLLPDAASGDRDVWLNHLGPSVEDGWRVFAARPPASPRDCYVDWSADDDAFIDNCDRTTYPPSGEGLPQYHVSVDADGSLTVDLRAPLTADPAVDSDAAPASEED